MGAHINRRPHNASSRRHARRHGSVRLRLTVACIYPSRLRASTFAWSSTTTNNHTSSLRLTLSSRHIRAPLQQPCAKLFRPYQRGRTTSKQMPLSRRASTPSLAQPDSTTGLGGVCEFCQILCYVISSTHPAFICPRINQTTTISTS